MLTDPPGLEDIEVSIFGPGKGESIAVHLGYGKWLIVDSCLDSTNGIPVLSYLDSIGVDVGDAVSLVICTHAHDDHFAGIARVLDACKSAYFVVSSAGTVEEYVALLALDAQIPISTRRSAVNEYRQALTIIKDRGRDNAGNQFLKYAHEHTELLSLRQAGPLPVKVTALSPSNEAITRSRRSLISRFPSVGDNIRASGIDPNELAVALWVEVGNKAILLGADVLRGPVGCGWSAIVANFHPHQKASLIKIPHHGSPGAHLDAVWNNLLVDGPTAILAPFNRGVTPLPSPPDIERICRMTSRAYVTATSTIPARSKAARREAALLGPLAKNVREASGTIGQIRARSNTSQSGWSIDLFRPARRLCDQRKSNRSPQPVPHRTSR
jgi:hypothetical protein